MALTSTEEALVRQLLDQQAAILSLAGNESTITSKLGATKVTLSDLVSASAVADADLFLLRQGTTDKSVTGAIVKALATQPDASETVKGIIELATVAEVQAGTDTVRAVTPAGVAAALPRQIQPITASVAANALTITLGPTVLDFRSTTLGNGSPNRRIVSAPISIVVPAGATLNTANGRSSRILVFAIDNAGTVELVVVNENVAYNTDETTLITSLAISAGATTGHYSTTARSNVPFRVVGVIESTQATAGQWATAPSLVQGCGGEALTSLASLGHGQSWQVVTGSRAIGTTYYNTTSRPIFVALQFVTASSATGTLTINGVAALSNSANAYYNGLFGIVPPGGSYVLSGVTGINSWAELR